MKKVLACALVCALLMLSAVALADTNLTLWSPPITQGGLDYFGALNAVMDRFHEEHPDVNVDVVELNFNGIEEKLETAMRADTTPDIYIDGTARTAKLPSTGLVVDVSDVLGSLDGWDASALKIGELDGGNYLVPYTLMPSTVLAINYTLAEKYGAADLLPEDRISWDWTQFMDFLRACGEKSVADGVYPVGLFAGSQSSDIAYYSMMLSAGAEIMNEDHTAAAVNTEAAVQTLSYLKQMVDEGLAYPGAAEMTDDNTQAAFLSGKTVVSLEMNGALSAVPYFEELAKEGTIEEVPELRSYAWPTLNGSTPRIATWGANCIAIFENEGDEEKIAAAKEVVSFLMQDKEFLESMWAANLNYSPARDMGLELKAENEQMLREAEVGMSFAPYNDSSFGPLESYWGEIRQGFYPELQSLFLGNKTPEEAIAAFESSVNDVLSHN